METKHHGAANILKHQKYWHGRSAFTKPKCQHKEAMSLSRRIKNKLRVILGLNQAIQPKGDEEKTSKT
jgi:hypothetical protein